MSQDPDQDDHLVFGAETESRVPASDRSRREATESQSRPDDLDGVDDGGDDMDAQDHENETAVYGAPDETTRVRPQAPPPPYAEPPVYETQPGPYDRRPPSYEEPYADARTDGYDDDQPRFVDPPPAFPDDAQATPPRFDEPASYERTEQDYDGPRYEDPHYDPSGYDQPRYDPPGYDQPRYERPRYDQSPDTTRYEDTRYGDADDVDAPPSRPSYDQPGYDQPGYDRAEYDQPRYDQPRYDQPRYAESRPWGADAGYDDDRTSESSESQFSAPRYSEADDSAPLFAETQNLAALRRDEDEAHERPAAPVQRDRERSQQSDPRQDYPEYREHDYPDATGYPDPTGRPDRRGAQHAAAPPSAAPAPPPRDEPPPRPRPEDLLAPNRYAQDTTPANWGWRGRVSRGSGGLFKPKASQAEMESRQAVTAIQRSFSRPMTVVVVQPKGGAGKTPTTICLSAAFGAHRGGYVVGWDDNETRGTLAVRVANPDNQRATVWDLLSDLDQFERFDARVGDLSYYVRAQPEAHFDALVSDDNPGNMAQIGEDEYRRLHQVLQRFYRLIVVDTGNNVRSPNWQAAVNSADLVVVVSTYQRDVGWSASWVLDHLAQTGREELARNAVTVLTSADPTFDKDVRDQLISHFSARTRAVAEIPYDPDLAHGGPIAWTNLAEATRNAWVHAGAIVVNALVEKDNKALDARRS